MPRWLARAPIVVFRAGAGRIFGGVLVMVEHTGRTSGLPRYVVLEVLMREPHAVVVAAGYGPGSQWLRNVTAQPRVRLWCGRTSGAAGSAAVLTPERARDLLQRYRREHPVRARFVARALGVPALLLADPLPADVGSRIPLVRFRSPQL
ncbi:MAG: nitroreductase family deazaflavin-dependent oxidoreductase [Georgenia sp.]